MILKLFKTLYCKMVQGINYTIKIDLMASYIPNKDI